MPSGRAGARTRRWLPPPSHACARWCSIPRCSADGRSASGAGSASSFAGAERARSGGGGHHRPNVAGARHREGLGAVEAERGLVLAVHAQRRARLAERAEITDAPTQQRAAEADAARIWDHSQDADLAFLPEPLVAAEADAAPAAIGKRQPVAKEARAGGDLTGDLHRSRDEMVVLRERSVVRVRPFAEHRLAPVEGAE